MKINYIQNQGITISYKNNLKKNLPENKRYEGKFAPLSSNPSYYQALNNISFGSSKEGGNNLIFIKDKGGISVFMKFPFLKQDNLIPVHFDEHIVSNYLTDESGDIDADNLKIFSNIFQGFVMNGIKSNHKNYLKYSKLSNEIYEGNEPRETEIFDKDGIENLSFLAEKEGIKANADQKRTSGELSPFKKRGLSKALADFHKNYPFNKIKDKATSQTADIFSLSKTKDGYNFSNMEKKLEISRFLQYIKRDFGDDEYKKILEFLKKEGGEKEEGLDLNYISILIMLASKQETSDIPIKKLDCLLQKYGDDIGETANILSFCSGQISVEDNDFENYFSKNFNSNTNKYSEKSAERFKDIVKEMQKLEIKVMEDPEIDDDEIFNASIKLDKKETAKMMKHLPSFHRNDFSFFEFFIIAYKKFLTEYFDTYTNKETGELQDDAPSAKSYAKTMEDKLKMAFGE